MNPVALIILNWATINLGSNSYLAPFSRTGKMPVPQRVNFLVEQASYLFIKSLLRMVQHLGSNRVALGVSH
jgi:hypothetical protein